MTAHPPASSLLFCIQYIPGAVTTTGAAPLRISVTPIYTIQSLFSRGQRTLFTNNIRGFEQSLATPVPYGLGFIPLSEERVARKEVAGTLKMKLIQGRCFRPYLEAVRNVLQSRVESSVLPSLPLPLSLPVSFSRFLRLCKISQSTGLFPVFTPLSPRPHSLRERNEHGPSFFPRGSN